MTKEKKEKQARVWPWVLIASVLLLVVVATLLNITQPKPIVQLGYVGHSDIESQENLWATNASSRMVMLTVHGIETNRLGQWYSSSIVKTYFSSLPSFWVPPHEQIRLGLYRPSGVDMWRARFIVSTEAKGWEIYWWYMRSCVQEALHGGALPQFPKSQ